MSRVPKPPARPKRHLPVTIRTCADVTLDPQNANRGTPRGRAALAESLKQYGPARSVVIDRAGLVVAGNKTIEQAQALGMPLQVIKSDGGVLVVVQRTDLDLQTDPRAKALAIADNRVGELDLVWDPARLEQLRTEGIELGTWWTEQEWATLVGPSAANPDEDQVLAPGPTTIRRGDFFTLGAHRLLCGDATDAADVARLLGNVVPVVMATDPPYGDSYDPSWRHRLFPGQRTAVGKVAHDTEALWPAAFDHFPGDVVYAWHAARATGNIATMLETVGFTLRTQIIWVKQHFALSRGDYHWQHEPCWYAVRSGRTSHWQGDRTQSSVWTVPNLNAMGGTRTEENTPTGHGTQKPVRLFEIPLLNHTTAGEAVYDPFLGSGTTLIAAEKLGRVAYAMDVDPQYVQIALTRWETFTGQRARRIGRAVTSRRAQ
jgi:DNA modification methylase